MTVFILLNVLKRRRCAQGDETAARASPRYRALVFLCINYSLLLYSMYRAPNAEPAGRIGRKGDVLSL